MGMNLGIIDKKPKNRWGVLSVEGEIQINDFTEGLYIPLDWWSVDDYLTQWKEAIERLKTHDRSCFVVTIHNPEIRKFIEWWPLYKFGDKVYVHNDIIIDDLYEEIIGDNSFTRETCYDFIPKYRSHTQEGNKISEWVIDWDGKIE